MPPLPVDHTSFSVISGFGGSRRASHFSELSCRSFSHGSGYRSVCNPPHLPLPSQHQAIRSPNPMTACSRSPMEQQPYSMQRQLSGSPNPIPGLLSNVDCNVSNQRLSLLQYKMLNHLIRLQPQTETLQYRDRRSSSVMHSEQLPVDMYTGLPPRTSNLSCDVLSDEELAELICLNQRAAKEASSVTAKSNIQPGDLSEAKETARTLTRQKHTVKKRKRKVQPRRASAPFLPLSLLDEVEDEPILSRNSILAPISEIVCNPSLSEDDKNYVLL